MGTRRRARQDIGPVVEVLCDDSGRVGPLSYRVPPTLKVHLGDAVNVPFGSKQRYGVVVGVGDAAKATKDIVEVFGPRSDQVEIAVAAALAEEHFCSFTAIAPRLGPRSRRGNPPLQLGPVQLRPGPSAADLGYPAVDEAICRRLLAPTPAVSMPRLAAVEAARLAEGGQVLILCPTKKDVAQVLDEFVDGAARLDVMPGAHDPSPWRGFVEGHIQVAVATRTAALWSAADLAGVVVVDEDHPGHDEQTQPYTNARTVALRRTAAANIAVSLLSRNPSLPALAGNVRLLSVGVQQDWPKATFIDTAQLPPAERGAPNEVLDAIADARRRGQPAFVVAPQASSTPRCTKCRLEEQQADTCGRCGGPVRGSLLAKEHLTSVYKKATVLSIQELLAARSRPGSLVVLIAADMLEAAADLVPAKALSQVCAAATRLAGADGRVLVTVRGSLPPTVVDLVLRPNVRRHARRVWASAKEDGLPPFAVLVHVRHQRSTAPKPPVFPAPIRVLGPRRRAANEFETMVLVPRDQVHVVAPWVWSLRRTGRVQVRVS